MTTMMNMMAIRMVPVMTATVLIAVEVYADDDNDDCHGYDAG